MGSVNTFDAAVVGIMIVAVVMGFRSGLLRALATILGYLCGAAVAVGAAPAVTRIVTEQLHVAPLPDGAVFAGLFIAAGMILAALMRLVVGELTGKDIGVADRMAGAMLGAVRIVLLAIVLVLVFDRIIPARPRAGVPRRLQAAPDLVGSRPARAAIAATRRHRRHRPHETRARYLRIVLQPSPRLERFRRAAYHCVFHPGGGPHDRSRL